MCGMPLISLLDTLLDALPGQALVAVLFATLLYILSRGIRLGEKVVKRGCKVSFEIPPKR